MNVTTSIVRGFDGEEVKEATGGLFKIVFVALVEPVEPSLSVTVKLTV